MSHEEEDLKLEERHQDGLVAADQALAGKRINTLLAAYRRLERAIIVGMVIIAVGTTVGVYSIRSETNTRTAQFCSLIVARDNQLSDQYGQTLSFLAAHPENTQLVKIVRENLPRQRQQLVTEVHSFPGSCDRSKLHGVARTE